MLNQQVDWDAALHSLSLHATVQYKLLRNARSVGYYPGRIIDNQRALCDFPKFIVLDSPGLGWFEERIKNNPDFAVKRLGSMPSRDPGPTQAWMVTRVTPSSACTPTN